MSEFEHVRAGGRVAPRIALGAALASGLAAGACGGEPKDCESQGQACTWLGIPGDEGFNGDGHHRLDTRLYWSFDMIFTADGTPFFIDWNNHQVRKVLPDDTVETVVGWTDPVFPGDGVPTDAEYSEQGAVGTEVQLNHPTDLAMAPNGDILLMAWHNHKLRRIDPETGRVWIVAGAGAGYEGDGGPAEDAIFKQPDAVEVGPGGEIYIADQRNQRVRMIGTDGVIDTIVGTGEKGFGGDGGPATEAKLNKPHDLEAGPDGHIYFADTDNNRIRAINPAGGTIRTVVGTGELGLDPTEGLPELETKLRRPFGLTFGPEGDLYVHDTINSRILRVAR